MASPHSGARPDREPCVGGGRLRVRAIISSHFGAAPRRDAALRPSPIYLLRFRVEVSDMGPITYPEVGGPESQQQNVKLFLREPLAGIFAWKYFYCGEMRKT